MKRKVLIYGNENFYILGITNVETDLKEGDDAPYQNKTFNCKVLLVKEVDEKTHKEMSAFLHAVNRKDLSKLETWESPEKRAEIIKNKIEYYKNL